MQTKEVNSKKFDAIMAKRIDLKKCPKCASYSAEIYIPIGGYFGSKLHKVRIKCTNCGFELRGHDISASIYDVENKRYGTPVIEKSLMGAIRQTINIWNGERSENGRT